MELFADRMGVSLPSPETAQIVGFGQVGRAGVVVDDGSTFPESKNGQIGCVGHIEPPVKNSENGAGVMGPQIGLIA